MSKARKTNATGSSANSGQFPRGARKEAERLKFIEWLALPANQRKPKTQAALARQLGVEPATLSDWKQNPNLWAEVRKRVDYQAKEHQADVLDALVKKAKQGDVQAQKLYLQYVQDWGERQRQETEHRESVTVNFGDISDKELDEIIEKTAE